MEDDLNTKTQTQQQIANFDQNQQVTPMDNTILANQANMSATTIEYDLSGDPIKTPILEPKPEEETDQSENILEEEIHSPAIQPGTLVGENSHPDYFSQKRVAPGGKKSHKGLVVGVVFGAIALFLAVYAVAGPLLFKQRNALSVEEFNAKMEELGYSGSDLISESNSYGGYSSYSHEEDSGELTMINYVYARDVNDLVASAQEAGVSEKLSEVMDEQSEYKFTQNCSSKSYCLTYVQLKNSLLSVVANQEETKTILDKIGYN